jgi:hypothetical protein
MAKSPPASEPVNKTAEQGPLSPEMLDKMNAYWRAANYLSVGQIYLKDNPLLKRPLTLDDVKPRLLGHWGTTPGLNFLYVHWNRLIRERGLNIMYVIGPGHGGPGLVANTYLEGSYSEIYPHIERNKDGIKRLFRQFSWPYGIPSHVAPETPGSRVRRGLRQSRPDCGLRGGRWRGRDRAAGDKLALKQVFESGHRWRGAANFAFKRIQDSEPDDPGAHSSCRAGRSDARLRLRAVHA